jgi:hypothetical protein
MRLDNTRGIPEIIEYSSRGLTYISHHPTGSARLRGNLHDMHVRWNAEAQGVCNHVGY